MENIIKKFKLKTTTKNWKTNWNKKMSDSF